jgi:hypothetical protein
MLNLSANQQTIVDALNNGQELKLSKSAVSYGQYFLDGEKVNAKSVYPLFKNKIIAVDVSHPVYAIFKLAE